jgi:hypothetical protein
MRGALPLFDLCITMVFISKATMLVGRKNMKMLMISVFHRKKTVCVSSRNHSMNVQCTDIRIKEEIRKITRNAIALLPVLNERDSFSCARLNISVTASGPDSTVQ